MRCEAEFIDKDNLMGCRRCDESWSVDEGRPEGSKCLPWSVPEILNEAAQTYKQRNAMYGDNYKRAGHMLAALFPDGIPAMSPDEWNQFAVWMMIFAKDIRYAMHIGKGGHLDSAHDNIVYSAMLEELTK